MEATTANCSDTPPAPKRASAKTQLVHLVKLDGTELFHGADGQPYATVTIGDHRETMHLAGRAYSDHLARAYYNVKGRVVSSGDLKDAIRVLTASAIHTGPQHDVFIRLARVGDTIWLDLGRPQWDAIKITRDGWSVVATPEVKFRRSRGLLALPEPVGGTTPLTVMLKTIINIIDPVLLIAWLIGALRGRKPYPILSVNGEHGTGKTLAERFLRRLIDPNVADLRTPPKDPRDLMIAGHNSHVIAFDNLSTIPDWLADNLCGLATGGGFSTRELFSDLDETLFSAARPIMLNGINDVVTRPDLLDRALVITLDPIAKEDRRGEAELERQFVQAHPAILGRLLDAVVAALAHGATTTIDELPRMADFATWVVAAEHAGKSVLGWAPGEFLPAYRQNQQEAIESVLDGDVVAEAIQNLPFVGGFWSGQLQELLAKVPEHEHKPKSPRGLRAALRRKAPALRGLGFTMTFTRGHVKKVEIRKAAAPNSAAGEGQQRDQEDDWHFGDDNGSEPTLEGAYEDVWEVPH